MTYTVPCAVTTAHTPRLSLAVEGTPSAGAGETLTYTVTYRNTGSAPATGVILTLDAPDGVTPRSLPAHATAEALLTSINLNLSPRY
ncbi:hypothetical protein ABZ815_19440 [Nonomuraea sp. NPDC047529]|uniref:hypothetical protein n=1 Tax=Nonomuraea sp. NPDC047529 TaxID=3155623 RepID=UPI0034061E24